MQVEWYGQSAFRLTDGATTVFIDPFDDLTALARARRALGLPGRSRASTPTCCSSRTSTSTTTASGAIGGEPVTLRSTAGRLESPIGEVARRRLRARRRRRHRARPQHALRLHARRPARGAPRRPRPDARCATSRRRRWAASTSSSSPSATARRSAPSRPPRSPRGSAPASSCRCTTAPSASTSSSPSTPSSRARSACERLESRAFDLEALAGGDAPLVVVPAAP